MKTVKTDSFVTTNAAERVEFKATNTAKIYNMLISSLYSDKPQSITREIWSNALDAHVASGQPERPFDVTFPSVFNPVFTVRDYGPSMDHETIMNIYPDLGESTKEDTNEEVGKWGIGSKSPFSYTDTFSVTTYIGGTARYYTAVRQGVDIPDVLLMGTAETDEPDGLEVSFPVDGNDVRKFRTAAQRVSYGFDVKPNVILDEDEEFEGWIEPDVLYEGDGWKLLKTPLEGYGGTAYAKMGCVLYPISVQNIEGLDSDIRQILSTTIVIDFPIGSLEITPSRESLQYGPKDPTSDSIRDRVQSIADEIGERLKAEYAACKTYWEACVKYNGDLDAEKLPEAVRKIIHKNAVWRGEKLRTKLPLQTKRSGDRNFLQVCEISGKKIGNIHVKFEHDQKEESATAAPSTVMIVEDLSLPHKERAKRVSSRVSRFRDENRHSIKQIVWVKFRGTGKVEAENMINLLERFDGIEVYAMNDLPPSEAIYSTSEKRPVKIKKLRSYHSHNFEEVDLSPEEMEEGGFYVKLCRNEVQMPIRADYPHTVVGALQRLHVIKNGAPIYAVPKTHWKRFENNSAWQEVYTVAEEYHKTHTCAQAIEDAKAVAEALENHVMQFVSDKVNFTKLDPNSDLIKGNNFFERLKVIDTSKADAMLALVTALGRESELEIKESSQTRTELDFYVELLTEAYPLLDVLARQCRHEDNLVDKVTHYAYMCDAAAEKLRAETAAKAA